MTRIDDLRAAHRRWKAHQRWEWWWLERWKTDCDLGVLDPDFEDDKPARLDEGVYATGGGSRYVLLGGQGPQAPERQKQAHARCMACGRGFVEEGHRQCADCEQTNALRRQWNAEDRAVKVPHPGVAPGKTAFRRRC